MREANAKSDIVSNTKVRESHTTLTPELRRFAELHHIKRLKLVDAWTQAKGREHLTGPERKREADKASRAWKGAAVQAYVAELDEIVAKGGHQGVEGALTERAEELERAKRLEEAAELVRKDIERYLSQIICVSPIDLFDDCGKIRTERGHLIQELRRTADGEVIVKMVSKSFAVDALCKMKGWDLPEKPAEVTPGFAAQLTDAQLIMANSTRPEYHP